MIAALAAWTGVATALDRTVRTAWPAYATALLAGAAAAALERPVGPPTWRGPPAWAGVALLVFFVPVHAQLWARFPPWYHALFLGSLVPLAVLGGAAVRAWRARANDREERAGAAGDCSGTGDDGSR